MSAPPRGWRAISHLAMDGAVGAACSRREPAIGEISGSRIAKRPSAGELADVLELHPPHFPDLGLGEGQRRLLLRLPNDPGTGTRNSRRRRQTCARGPGGRGGSPIAVELDPDPIRLADHGVPGRRAERQGDVARASSLERQPFENLDRLFGPQHVQSPNVSRRAARARAGTTLNASIPFVDAAADCAASAPAGHDENFIKINVLLRRGQAATA